MIFIMCCPFYRIYEVTLYTTFGMDVSEGLRETENPNIIDAIKDFLEQGEFIPAEYKGNEQLEILLFLYLLLVCVEVVILIVGIGYLKELIVYKEPVDGYILAETILS